MAKETEGMDVAQQVRSVFRDRLAARCPQTSGQPLPAGDLLQECSQAAPPTLFQNPIPPHHAHARAGRLARGGICTPRYLGLGGDGFDENCLFGL
jgi:hypothetical protein